MGKGDPTNRVLPAVIATSSRLCLRVYTQVPTCLYQVHVFNCHSQISLISSLLRRIGVAFIPSRSSIQAVKLSYVLHSDWIQLRTLFIFATAAATDLSVADICIGFASGFVLPFLNVRF